MSWKRRFDWFRGAGAAPPPTELPKPADGNFHDRSINQEARRLKIAFFGYSWREDGVLDPYMAESIDGIRSLGVDVDLYLGNHFTRGYKSRGIDPQLSVPKLAAWIRDQNYAFAVSFNNSLILKEIVNALDCSIVSVVVDSESHLFDHAESGGFSAFNLAIVVAPIYSSLQDDLKRIFPEAASRVHFLPPATKPQPKEFQARESRCDVVWIASLLGDADLDKLIGILSVSRSSADIVIRGIRQVEKTGYLDTLRNDSAAEKLVNELNWDIDLFERQIQNIVTNDQRISLVTRLGNHDFRLFGNERWLDLVPYNTAIAKAFSFSDRVYAHVDLMKVYNSAKIAVNLPQIQAKTGVQYRVLDIMASRALLVSKFVENSDLEKMFGPNLPIPRFKTEDEMVKMVEYYLHNEDQREDLVRQCNHLVSSGFSFAERAAEYLRLSNPEASKSLPAPNDEYGSQPLIGCLTRIDRALFYADI